MSEKECLGFLEKDLRKEENTISSEYDIYIINCKDSFPCVPVSEHEAFKEKVRRAVIVQRNLDGSIITHINKRALCYVDLKLIKELGLSSVSSVIHTEQRKNTEELIKKHKGNEKEALKEFLSSERKEPEIPNVSPFLGYMTKGKPVVRVRFGRGSYPTELKVVRGVK